MSELSDEKDALAERLRNTFARYVAADDAADRAYIRYQRFEVSDTEVQRLQGLAAQARREHLAVIEEVRRG